MPLRETTSALPRALSCACLTCRVAQELRRALGERFCREPQAGVIGRLHGLQPPRETSSLASTSTFVDPSGDRTRPLMLSQPSFPTRARAATGTAQPPPNPCQKGTLRGRLQLGRRVPESSHQPEAVCLVPALNGKRPLTGGRKHHLFGEDLRNDLDPAESFQSGSSRDHGVVGSRGVQCFAKPCPRVAAQVDDLKIGARTEQLGRPPAAARSHACPLSEETRRCGRSCLPGRPPSPRARE